VNATTIIVVAAVFGVLIVAGLALVVGLSALSYRDTRELGKAVRKQPHEPRRRGTGGEGKAVDSRARS